MAELKPLILRSFAEQHFKTLAKRYHGSFTGEAFERAAQEIAEMPGLDVVNVVRCKNCRGINRGVARPEGRFLCERISRWVYPDDFCSQGERRSDG